MISKTRQFAISFPAILRSTICSLHSFVPLERLSRARYEFALGLPWNSRLPCDTPLQPQCVDTGHVQMDTGEAMYISASASQG